MAGRGVLVTGVGGRIGAAIARTFAAGGDRVVASDVNEETLTRRLEEMGEAGKAITPTVADLTQEADIERLAAEAEKALGQIEVLVNCAGIFPNAPVIQMEPAEWDRVYAVNLRAPFILTRAVARQMIDRGLPGAIVNISSGAGSSARTGGAHYCGSKAALNMLTKVLAIELGPYGIRVNAVAPGLILDEVVGKGQAEQIGEYAAALLKGIPLGRTGDPQDIANAVRWVCSPEASWVSGEILGVNGASQAGRTHLPPSTKYPPYQPQPRG